MKIKRRITEEEMCTLRFLLTGVPAIGLPTAGVPGELIIMVTSFVFCVCQLFQEDLDTM